jgi:hypothetical protein
VSKPLTALEKNPHDWKRYTKAADQMRLARAAMARAMAAGITAGAKKGRIL